MRRSFAFKLTLLTLLWLLLAIGCQQVPPSVFWPVAFGALTTPVALALTALLVLYWLRRNWRVAALPLAALVLTWPQVQRGLALHFNEELGTEGRRQPMRNEELEGAKKPGKAKIPHSSFFIPHSRNEVSLLSANVRIFNVYAELREPDNASSVGFIRWLAESPADVLCLQEFYNEPRGSRQDGDVFRSVARLGAGSGRHAFSSNTFTNSIGAEFGLAIFSRFPIVRRGSVWFSRRSQNHAMWADLARPAAAGRRADTIRVFNLHLQSMAMADADLAAATTSRAGLRRKAPGLLRRFRNGAVARAAQIDTIAARVARSPYPVLLAGDLNDLPYSYTYDQLADRLQNAWATAGTGIGATYNGRLPLLRIDQQFAGPQWRVRGCRVHREIRWSDHFPVEGLYQLSVNSEQ
ncbi:endonuclease/exonuclease/phosphatase family protein [Hymenobacter sp.]|uniref:endonuclease/exonuclease/phosphatase family protein n=1 Tax=Hymenobacter sp. TaxID=1898978 RepID=UPI00286C4AA1|nr:endonuclease/exonuclease/phosphatase family protein [Hymenobacter sp.]